MTYIAMDVHKTTSTLAYCDPATGEVGERKIYTKRTELADALEDLTGPWVVAVEAAREAPAVCNWLRECDAEIHLVNPEKLAALGKLQAAKTDLKDAMLMLHALVHDYLPEAYLAPPQVPQRRAISRGRQAMRQTSTQLRNLLRTAFCHIGMQIAVSNLTGKEAREMMPQWLEQLPQSEGFMAAHFWVLLKQVEDRIELVDADIRDHIAADEVGRALCQFSRRSQRRGYFGEVCLPGIGAINAFGIMAEIGEIERFEHYKHLHSYAGLVPQVSQSGERRYVGELPQRCHKPLRTMAIQAAQSAIRSSSNSRAKRAFNRIKPRHGYNTAKVAAARKLLTDVYFTWRRIIGLEP